MVDIRQTPQYAKYLSPVGWKVERITETNYFIKKLPLVGSILKVQRPEEIKFAKIMQLAKKYRSIQIIVEPKSQLDAAFLKSLGFRLSKSPYLPTKTLQIDLTQTKQKIIKGFAKDTKRAIIKTKKIETRRGDIEKFRNAWKKAVGIKRYIPSFHQLSSLRKAFLKRSLFLMTQDYSAGAIFLLGDKMAYYWQAFTSDAGRKSLSQYKIVWEGILWAKGLGAKVFDFEGIYDERFPDKSWTGFTHFKKSFGGYEVQYPGTFKKERLPI